MDKPHKSAEDAMRGVAKAVADAIRASAALGEAPHLWQEPLRWRSAPKSIRKLKLYRRSTPR